MGTSLLTFGKLVISLRYELPVPEHLRISPVEGYNYIRSDAVLSPSSAQEQPPMSRGATQAAMAREAYYKSMQPAQYGVHMHNIRDVSHQQQASRYENHAKVCCFLVIARF
jgi:hypothetical protein